MATVLTVFIIIIVLVDLYKYDIKICQPKSLFEPKKIKSKRHASAKVDLSSTDHAATMNVR